MPVFSSNMLYLRMHLAFFSGALYVDDFTIIFCMVTDYDVQLLKAYRIKFQKFAAHAHKDALINETFIPT